MIIYYYQKNIIKKHIGPMYTVKNLPVNGLVILDYKSVCVCLVHCNGLASNAVWLPS